MKLDELFYNTGVIPVIKIEKPETAVPLAEALLEAGIPIAEITFRTEAAEKGIELLKREVPSVLAGAGTVLTLDQLSRAAGAGADFIVTPGFNPEVVDLAIKLGKPVYPGVNSPTQVEMGLSRGLRVLKFFPAEVSGGTAMLKALQPVYNVKFIPTGGVSLANLADYLKCLNVLACGGSWMVKADLIDTGNFREITRLGKEAVEEVNKIREFQGN